MFKKNQFAIFFAAYFLVRIFSYFFTPPTPLLAGSVVNSIIAILILILSGYWIIKNDIRGWIIVMAEIFLGGSGNILSVFSISLRTLLLIISVGIFFIQSFQSKSFNKIFSFKLPNIFIFFLIDWAIISAVIGIMNGNSLSLVISDFIPYLFFLYYFPLTELVKIEKFKTTAFNMLAAALTANALFVIYTFILYGIGAFEMQDAYYHWFRDVAQGKITGLGFNFVRIVLNEHLLLVPLILFFVWRNLRTPSKINDLLIICGAAILSINLTRIYFLALLVGLIVLYSKNHLKNWLLNAVILLSCVFIFYTGFYLFASHGQDPGWSYFGFRVSSIAMPDSEFSSLSRMILLPQILYKIQLAPAFGHGLGDTVTVVNNLFGGAPLTTPHFDWGYLEIMDEIGFIGFALWITVIVWTLCYIKKSAVNDRALYYSIIFAILVTNITSPALFHVFSIIALSFIIARVRVSSELSNGLLQNGG